MRTTIAVLYHRQKPTPSNPCPTKTYAPVARATVRRQPDAPTDSIPLRELDQVFAWTQNTQGSWSLRSILGDAPNPDWRHEVEPIFPSDGSYGPTKNRGYRSTSVGDVVELEGTFYLVTGDGFVPFDALPDTLSDEDLENLIFQ